MALKQHSFLGNRQHTPVAMDKHVATQVLLETVFSTRSTQRGYKEDNLGYQVSSVWEAAKKRVSFVQESEEEAFGREPPFKDNLSM
jgi:hypothetical protein